MKKTICTLIYFLCSALVFSQREPDKTYMPNIKGIKLFQHGNQITYPVIDIGTTNSLELHFDDLDGYVKNYSYTYQLCNANWKPVDLNVLDYIQGFTEARLNQYRASSIAKVKYVHYQALLPDKSCMPSKAGNYLLKVFLNSDTGKLAFTKRILVVNNIVPVGVKILQPYNSELMRTHHKVQFSIDKTKLNIFNPKQQLKVVVLQNYRWDNAVTGIQPVFMRGNIFEYNGEQDCLFPAGKEFRWADLRSFRFQSERINKINNNSTPADVYLRPDPERTNERFLMLQDVDGFFDIDCTDANNPWWQGDYGNIHFTFLPNGHQPYPDKDVYIMGEMTGYAFNDSTKLQYNAEQGVYEKTLLLKQGYYSYTYVTKDIKAKNEKAATSQTDGDYWETENTYTVLVYYQSLGGRYDELVGAISINSRNGRHGF
ncbi:MAG TPA: DUF5103 domain-containing protein [Chitinophagaceae bacterium]|nr:DUF5103 domain-containing protein [Chitinophagaceae bacterium]